MTSTWSREGGTVRFALGLAVPLAAALLQGTVAPLVAVAGARPLLPILVAGSWAVAAGASEAVWWAFIAGIATDLLSGGPLGAFALAFLPPIAAIRVRDGGRSRGTPAPAAAALVALAASTAGLPDIELVHGDYYRDLSQQNRSLRLPVLAERGGIVDRNGYVLARNLPAFAVSVVPVDIPRAREQELSQRLGALLDLPAD